MIREERRRYQRINLPTPLRGTIGDLRIFVIDVSVSGMRVAHQDPLPPIGGECLVRFSAPTGPLSLHCKVVRTAVHRRAAHAGEKTVYHSGLEIDRTRVEADRTVRELIAYYVERALDEQKANARGIPATAALSFQTGKGTEFVRMELIRGEWRRSVTKDATQPPNGFTISSAEGPDHVAMLCAAYESGDNEGRRLIRMMAELSISKSEGIPTRRYEP